ncbi:MAG TPA: putative Ig domain-containing protein [Polyangiaceae bacterium]|nr:putative Ig domain-containing protein [Polyangiaceae bacterium]
MRPAPWTLLSIVFCSTGCFSPDLTVTDCKIPCDPGPCPSGAECRAGYCVREGSKATCSETTSADAGMEGSAGSGAAGGNGGSGTGALDTGGSGAVGRNTDDSGGVGGTSGSPSAGYSNDSGVGGTDASPPHDSGTDTTKLHDVMLPLDFTVSAQTLCAEVAANLTLTASGGTPPYRFQLEQAPAGWALGAQDGATVALAQSSVQSGGEVDLVVVLTDFAGRSVNHALQFPVHDVPKVATSTLPTACAAVPYGFEFTAAGGDSASYKWSLLQTNGTNGAFQQDVLFVTPTTGDLSLTVQVADAYCTSAPASFTVHTDPNPDTCPSIDPTPLPSPCKGYPYNPTALSVDSGSDLTWRALSLPDGIRFDSTKQTLSGVPLAAGPSSVDVEVVDGSGRIARSSFPVNTRRHCWVAYVSTNNGHAELNRFDPDLVTRDVVSHTTGPGVEDFAFSPDGNYLVYKTRDADGNATLVLTDAESWTEHAVALPAGTVLAYAWSNDSRTVAVAGQNGDDTWLSGLRVFPPKSEAIDGGAVADAGAAPSTVEVFAEPVELLAPGATFSSTLTWVGTSGVAFLAHQNRGTDTNVLMDTYYAALLEGADGAAPQAFAAPLERTAQLLDATTQLDGRASGFFAVETSERWALFFGTGKQNYLYQLPSGVADPDGVYVASVASGNLNIYAAVGTPPSASAPPWVSANGCGSVLAWALHRDRIVCDTPSGQGAQSPLRVFDLDSNAATLTGTDIRQTNDYATGASIERRRVLSPSGNWFAVTTDASLYLVDVSDTTTPHVVTSHKLPTNARVKSTNTYTELLFSPDERFLLFQMGNAFAIQQVDKSNMAPTPMDFTPLAPSAPCSETYNENPAAWCGSPHDTSIFTWSNDSLVVAGKTADGKITTWNLADIDESLDFQYACTTGCTGEYQAQP